MTIKNFTDCDLKAQVSAHGEMVSPCAITSNIFNILSGTTTVFTDITALLCPGTSGAFWGGCPIAISPGPGERWDWIKIIKPGMGA